MRYYIKCDHGASSVVAAASWSPLWVPHRFSPGSCTCHLLLSVQLQTHFVVLKSWDVVVQLQVTSLTNMLYAWTTFHLSLALLPLQTVLFHIDAWTKPRFWFASCSLRSFSNWFLRFSSLHMSFWFCLPQFPNHSSKMYQCYNDLRYGIFK